MATTKKKWSFAPFTAEQPPAGYYDPSLDAQLGATQRGLQDTQADTDTANVRDTVDYGLGMNAIQQSQDRSGQDLGADQSQLDTTYGRSLQDAATSLQRNQQGYDQSVAALTRNYGQLAGAQRQQDASHGVIRGGAMLQAAAKRTTNEQIDQAPLDQSWQQAQQDNALQVARLGQDYQTNSGQIALQGTRDAQDADLQRGQLGLTDAPPDAANPFGGRNFQDRTTALTRAQREASQFGLDTTAAKDYEATAAGWTPPSMPSNEFVDPTTGVHRQLHQEGNMIVATDSTGRVLWRRPKGSAA